MKDSFKKPKKEKNYIIVKKQMMKYKNNQNVFKEQKKINILETKNIDKYFIIFFLNINLLKFNSFKFIYSVINKEIISLLLIWFSSIVLNLKILLALTIKNVSTFLYFGKSIYNLSSNLTNNSVVLQGIE